jgi:hypothetical protein
MAGLTKEQRAAREADRADEKASASPEEGLVRVVKAGESLDVHPTCLAAHKALGWVESE